MYTYKKSNDFNGSSLTSSTIDNLHVLLLLLPSPPLLLS
jgi:hypothetical protein